MAAEIKSVLLAGGSGHLGRYTLQVLKARGYFVRLLVLSENEITDLSGDYDEVVTADITRPETLQTVCRDIDAVISCAGASLDVKNLKDKNTFYAVDFQGNKNLLDCAKHEGVKKFIYVSVFGAEKQRHLEYSDAHENFVEELYASKVPFTVIRPTGFFYIFGEIFNLARAGMAIQIGRGKSRTNPIHEADLADFCVEALQREENELPVGGPEIMTRYETAALAFEALGKKPRVLSVPPFLFKVASAAIKPFNRRIYALLNFGATVSTNEIVAPQYGSHRLIDYYRELRENNRETKTTETN